jgi:hypothetical protein
VEQLLLRDSAVVGELLVPRRDQHRALSVATVGPTRRIREKPRKVQARPSRRSHPIGGGRRRKTADAGERAALRIISSLRMPPDPPHYDLPCLLVSAHRTLSSPWVERAARCPRAMTRSPIGNCPAGPSTRPPSLSQARRGVRNPADPAGRMRIQGRAATATPHLRNLFGRAASPHPGFVKERKRTQKGITPLAMSPPQPRGIFVLDMGSTTDLARLSEIGRVIPR